MWEAPAVFWGRYGTVGDRTFVQEWLRNGSGMAGFGLILSCMVGGKKPDISRSTFVEDVSGKPRMIQLKAEPWILMGNVCGAQLIHGS